MIKIEELINLFRKYGGVFENVELKYTEEYGYFLCSLNSNQDTIVSCPDNLLVDINDVDINENGLFINKPQKYTDNMEFLEKYFEFHFNKCMLDHYIDKKKNIEALSKNELNIISKVFSANLHKAKEYTDLEFAKKQIIISHNIGHFDTKKQVLMPFVTFINCHKDGAPYNIQQDSISISGRFREQVFATYNNFDVMMFAENGFIDDTRNVYSYPLSNTMPDGTRVIINRDPEISVYTDKGHRRPVIDKTGNTISLSWFPLYREGAPLFPLRISQTITANSGIRSDHYLQQIFRYNADFLRNAVIVLNKSENSFARFVSLAAQRQLRLLGVI